MRVHAMLLLLVLLLLLLLLLLIHGQACSPLGGCSRMGRASTALGSPAGDEERRWAVGLDGSVGLGGCGAQMLVFPLSLRVSAAAAAVDLLACLSAVGCASLLFRWSRFCVGTRG